MPDPTPDPIDHLESGGLLPFEDANPDRRRRRRGGEAVPFLYIGEGLDAAEFADYVARYNFGGTPPDFVVLHHTAVPSTLATRLPKGDVWDAGEGGLSAAQIKAQRQKKLEDLRDYYRDTLGWDRGPHLYIDDRWIWLFTPMYNTGVHAMWGNSFNAAGHHYSVGIEVVGYYEQRAWPPEVARLVGHAVAVLKRQLGTFDLRYLYPNGGPGRVAAGVDKHGNTIWKCAHPELLRAGGLSSHRDYNKPQCPGAAVTEAFYVDAITQAWQRLENGTWASSLGGATPDTPQPAPGRYAVRVAEARVRQGPGTGFPIALGGAAELAQDTVVNVDTVVSGEAVSGNAWWGHLDSGLGFVAMALLDPRADDPTVHAQGTASGVTEIGAETVTPDTTLLALPRAPLDRCQRYLVAQPHGSYSDDDARYIARLYFEAAQPVGLDPLLVIAQMVEETGCLTSDWSQPPRRNPAGIGVTGEPGVGLQFPSWPVAVRAHVGRLLAYAVAKGTETPAQSALIAEALGWRPLPDNLRGVAPTLAGLAGRWAADQAYAGKIARVANEIARFGGR